MSDADREVFVAAAAGDLRRLKSALEAGGDPGAASEDGRTPLIMAARAGHVDGIRALVSAGADPAAAAGFFGTPLEHAATEGHIEAVRALVELGVPVQPQAAGDPAPLVRAVESDDPELIRYLVSAGADIEQRNAYRQTALIAAAKLGKARAAALLLELGADREARDGFDQTALGNAEENGREAVIALLQGRTTAAEIEAIEPEAPSYRYLAPAGQWLEVDGVAFTEESEDAVFVRGLLAGKETLGLHDHYPYDRLQRIWKRLEEVQHRLEKATAACLDDHHPLVRSQALMFFRERPGAEGAERIEELAEARPELFAGVPDPKSPGQDLEWTLLEALAARARLPQCWQARNLAEKRILEPGKGEPLMGAMSADWLASHAEEIVRATPATGAYLIGLLLGRGNWLPLLPLAVRHETFDSRMEWYVSDASQREWVRALAGHVRAAERADAPEADANEDAEEDADASEGEDTDDDPTGAAHYQAGLAAFNGDGREKDDAESFRLHGEAARRGHADALFELHVFHAQGIGCDVDLVRAAECLRQAAEKGQPRACYNLGAFHATGRQPAIPRDDAQAVLWYRRAADLGHGKAAATLAAMHLTGQGAPRSIERFNEMLLRAVELGFDAAGFLSSMGLKPPPIPAAD